MTVAIDQGPVTGGVTSGDSSTVGSWTPSSNALCLLFVALRDETNTVTASGNGLTWVEIFNLDNVQNQGGLHVFRAMGSSPTTGSITVTHTGNTLPVSCVAVSFSGVDTSGTNGSGAIGNTASDTGPDPDDDDLQITGTIDASGNWSVAAGWYRNGTLSDPPGTGETTIIVDAAFGTGGSTTNCAAWYDTGNTGSVTMGDAANLSKALDHIEAFLEVVEASAAAGAAPPPRRRIHRFWRGVR